MKREFQDHAHIPNKKRAFQIDKDKELPKHLLLLL